MFHKAHGKSTVSGCGAATELYCVARTRPRALGAHGGAEGEKREEEGWETIIEMQ